MSRSSNENAGVLPEMEADALNPAETNIRERMGVKPGLLKGVSCGLLIVGIAVLGWFSFCLAATRIYHVDECWNVYVARLIATGASGSQAPDLFQSILSRMTSSDGRSADLFAFAREFSLMIFWLNLILLAMATGERILSPCWLVALAGAATLAPFWDYGIEVRNENLLLAGILFIWGMVRFQPPRLGSIFFVGMCFVGLEFIAAKAVLYIIPIFLGILIFPRPGDSQPRWKLIAAWCLGAMVAFFSLELACKLLGLGHGYFTGVWKMVSEPSETLRFWPFKLTLSRLLTQTPLLLAVTTSAVIACVATLRRQRRAALNWDGVLPEVLLLGIALAVVFLNSDPFPYDLPQVVPYAFLVAFRYGAILWKRIPQRSGLVPVTLCIVAFTHLLPFGIAARGQRSRTNYRQEQLMNLTENLTDPAKDTVFDGIGMVVTRNACDTRAFIHGQTLKKLENGSGPHIRDMLAANPPSVIIPNYRTDWLPNEDWAFISKRYVFLAGDFLVLGNLLPAGGGTFQVYHAGRYRITSAEGSNIIGTYAEPKNFKEAFATQPKELPLAGTIDGVPLNGRPVELSVGTHRIECVPQQSAAVVWVGPHLDEVARMSGYNHQFLFDN